MRIVLLVLVAITVIFLLVRWLEGRGQGARQRSIGEHPASGKPKRAVAPDDDPDFLRRIDPKRRPDEPTGTDSPGPSD